MALLRGPKFYTSDDTALGTDPISLEFAPTNPNQRAVGLNLRNTHDTAVITYFGDADGKGTKTIPPNSDAPLYFPEGVKKILIGSDTASTTYEITTYERVFKNAPDLGV